MGPIAPLGNKTLKIRVFYFKLGFVIIVGISTFFLDSVQVGWALGPKGPRLATKGKK